MEREVDSERGYSGAHVFLSDLLPLGGSQFGKLKLLLTEQPHPTPAFLQEAGHF